jgi:hypothetical protein
MSMKRIVFCTFGSLGDIYPQLALAREMQLRGHWQVIAITPGYRGTTTGCDLVERLVSGRPGLTTAPVAHILAH